MTVRIDKHLPTFDYSERHETLVHATPTDVFAALRRADLRSGPLIRTLFALRSVPGLLIAPRATLRRFHGRDRGRPVTGHSEPDIQGCADTGVRAGAPSMTGGAGCPPDRDR
jgi:hypothetical protein